MRSIGSALASSDIGWKSGKSAPVGSGRSSLGSPTIRRENTCQRATVADTEAAVRASLPLSVRSSLRFQTASLIATDGQYDGDFVAGVEIVGSPSRADLAEALAVLDDACRPAPNDRIVNALAELALVSKAKTEDGQDTAMRIAALARLLHDWPADVALAAIRRHRDGGRFFPAWSDLLASCRILAGKRMATREAVRRRLAEAKAA